MYYQEVYLYKFILSLNRQKKVEQVGLMSEDTINNVMFDRRSQYIKPDFYL